MPPLDHEKFLRRSFEVARGARGSGNHPFGAIPVDAAGAVLLEVETGFMPDRAMNHLQRRPLLLIDGLPFPAKANGEGSLS